MPHAEVTQPVLQDNHYLKHAEVAALLGVTQRTLQNWVRDGRFPQPMRLTRIALRWRREDIDAFLAKGVPV